MLRKGNRLLMRNTVELIGFYGSDETHALSAWTSTQRELTPDKRARMGRMLAELASNGHHTPFEKSFLHFLVRCDVATHIHLIKHRVGVSVNAESARYKELKEDTFYVPEDWPEGLRHKYSEFMGLCYRLYHDLIEGLVLQGMDRKRAKESARFVLPYGNQTTMDVAFNFRSFMHFQSLRNDPHAQREVRKVAEEMLWLVWRTGVFDLSLLAFGYEPGHKTGS